MTTQNTDALAAFRDYLDAVEARDVRTQVEARLALARFGFHFSYRAPRPSGAATTDTYALRADRGGRR